MSSSTSSSLSSSAAVSESTVYEASEEKTNGTRLARLLIDGGTDVLSKFLHSIHPFDKLKNELKNNLPKLRILKSKGVIFPDQWKKLFPATDCPPESSKFDITLLHLLIRELCHLHPPVTGWHKMPAEDDGSVQANITRIKCFRNELAHSASTGISNDEFKIKWNKISSSLEAIVVEVYRRKIQVLKDGPIYDSTREKVEEEVEQWRQLEQQEKDQVINELCSCLPEKLPEVRVFGRSQELEQVKNDIQSGNVAVVLITGGPGFGKTTMAIAAAHELAKPETGKTVLFCSLQAKRSLTEVTTEMLYSCGKTHIRLQESPDQWLKDWSKRIQTQVTFVLDNVDGVLDSEDRDSFLSTLRWMRTQSNQKLTFVITSRTIFNYPGLRSTEVSMERLSTEEAKKVLVSRINHDDIRPEQLSKKNQIVELCGRVPLALSIVGSLLSYYTEEKLITHLEKEPMAILEDGDKSVRMAIKASFDILSKDERDALVLLSVFPGSFDCDAAEAVLRQSLEPETLPISILRSLKNRSLIEPVRSRRFQLHPLIRAFAKKVDQKNDPQLLLDGEKLGCAHFLSRLDGNAKMYWGKDTCKKSIESFSLDRNNFEYFLQVFAQGIEDQDDIIMDNCQKLLVDFPQKCMYLEKCLQPKFFIQVLERLLKSFKPRTQPVLVVDLLCLVGHEMRKVGEQEKYKDYMGKASELYSESGTAFERKPLSQVIYLESQARFLAEANKFGDLEPKEFYETALKICQEKLPDHPETAAVLLFAGRNAKRRKKNQEASVNFEKAYGLFKKQLGDHFMTAQCLKDIADFFFADKTNNKLDEALGHYKMAMEMMEKLGTQDQKESILTLKNYGICHGRKGNFEEAKRLLQKAERVAERKLEKNHTWKVMIKTSLGVLYHEEANKTEMEASSKEALLNGMETAIKEGLDMHYSIVERRSIKQLSNKKFIFDILNLYPERFPEDQYPRK